MNPHSDKGMQAASLGNPLLRSHRAVQAQQQLAATFYGTTSSKLPLERTSIQTEIGAMAMLKLPHTSYLCNRDIPAHLRFHYMELHVIKPTVFQNDPLSIVLCFI
jgi:hypothetical protein